MASMLKKKDGHVVPTMKTRILTGLAVIVPVVLVIFVVTKVLDIGAWLGSIMLAPFIEFAGISLAEAKMLSALLPAISLVLFILATAFVGSLVTNRVIGKLYASVDTWAREFPLLGKLYGACRQVAHSLFVEQREYLGACWVEYPCAGHWVPALITHATEKGLTVYIPTSPNPTSGFTIHVGRDLIVESKANMDSILQYIFSCGVVILEDLQIEKEELPRTLRLGLEA